MAVRGPARKSSLKISNAVRIYSTTSARKWEASRHYIRADAEPNWSQRVKEKEGDVVQIASKPAIAITMTSTVIDAVELMYEKRVRGLVVVSSNNTLKGTLMATDIVNYLGGGATYRLVEQRHKRDIFSALRSESVESLMNPTPLYATVRSKVTDVLRVMVLNGVGLVPIVDDKGSPVGVVTEHDLVRHLVSNNIGIKVSNIMTSNIVAAYETDSIKRAAQLMSLYGFRRVPVLSKDSDSIVGILSALDFISFFGSHEALKRLTSYDIEDVLSTPVSELMTEEVYTVNEDADIGEAAQLMNKFNTNSLLVVDKGGEVKGIVTERDILVSLAIR